MVTNKKYYEVLEMYENASSDRNALIDDRVKLELKIHKLQCENNELLRQKEIIDDLFF